ncbi:MAG: Holliday junction resolvase RuvX [Firmicutes bacterium]|nr:Holliday junction resolvase RuvX [Bacillota bacterium]
MRYIGLDLGTKTLGISISDETKTIASPFKTIRFSENNNDEVLDELKEIVKEFHVEKIILGLPKNMNNTIGDRALETMDFQKKLNDLLKIDVVLQDERLSTVSAHNYLLEANVSRKKRKGVVDKMAANIILQTYLDKEKGMLK